MVIHRYNKSRKTVGDCEVTKKIVAITAKKGHGKDTFAKPLIEAGYCNIKFADAIKSMIRSLLIVLGINKEEVHRYIEGDLKETPIPQANGKSARELMQTLGTEWGRECVGANFWADTCVANIHSSGFDKIVVTDMRFPNELEALRKAAVENGWELQTFRIVRDLPDNDFSWHPSERYIDTLPVGMTVANNGSIEDLAKVAITEILK